MPMTSHETMNNNDTGFGGDLNLYKYFEGSLSL